MKRFGHESGGTEFQHSLLLDHAAARHEDHRGAVVLRFEHAQQFEPIHAFHVDIAQDEVRHCLRVLRQKVFCTAVGRHIKSVRNQYLAQGTTQGGIVFNDGNLGGDFHGSEMGLRVALETFISSKS